MKKIILPKLGMRIIKTALAILVSLLLTDLLFNRTFGWTYFMSNFAVISAVLTIQDSIRRSLSSALERVLGTIIGVLFGMICLSIDLLLGKNLIFFYFAISLGSVLVIYVCKVAKKVSASSLCVVVFIAVLFSRDSDLPYIDAGVRVAETMVGVVVALIINIAICPPRTVDMLSAADGASPSCITAAEKSAEELQDEIDDIFEGIHTRELYSSDDKKFEALSECEVLKPPEYYI